MAAETPDACGAGKACNRHGHVVGQLQGSSGAMGPEVECSNCTVNEPLARRLATSCFVAVESSNDVQQKCGVAQTHRDADGWNNAVAKTDSSSAATNLLSYANTLRSTRDRLLIRHTVFIGCAGSVS